MHIVITISFDIVATAGNSIDNEKKLSLSYENTHF